MLPRKVPARTALAWVVACGWMCVGCGGPQGSGQVEVNFFEGSCLSDDPDPEPSVVRFDASYLATQRFAGILVIQVQEFRVNLEETDGLLIRLNIDHLLEEGQLVVDERRSHIVRSDPAVPLELPVGSGPGQADVSFSLFQTCADFPTSHGASGALSLRNITLAEDAVDTGENERITGTVTATLSRADLKGPAGTLRADFDFAPPRRPLLDFE